METTFISIHDLSENLITLYSSDSVIDVLGYTPDELVNLSAWELFHPDELPIARKIHGRKVSADKAAVLAYCRIRDKSGQWVGCECCFSIVYDVMIACTSIYRRGLSSEKRALEAPLVRRCFSSSPNDPRYHMLSHISAKFSQPVKEQQHEPRAALFLNRFTRTLTIMYATTGLKDVIGIPAEEMRGRSFYYCIAENCLQDAVKCLENAKGNDSLAYLRFWFRDPRLDDEQHSEEPTDTSDEEMSTEMSEDLEDGGVHLGDDPLSLQSDSSEPARSASSMEIDEDMSKSRSRNSSDESTRAADTHEAIFGSSRAAKSSESSLGQTPEGSPVRLQRDPIELEAVISCASDGLVVCLRRARPMIPHPTQRPSRPVYANGLFAAPWASDPILPPLESRGRSGFGPVFAPALSPQGAHRNQSPATSAGPEQHDYMNAIRDQAIFAWALTGINGSLIEYGKGTPLGESLPRDGLPIWMSEQPRKMETDASSSSSRSGQESSSTIRGGGFGPQIFGDPGLANRRDSAGRSIGSRYGAGTPR